MINKPEEWDWVRDNVPVWYRPSLRSDARFAGRVNGEPWSVGSTADTWVVLLDEMEPAYRHGRGTVKAAYLGALEPREEKQSGRLPPLSFKKGSNTFWLYTLGNNGHPYPTQTEATLEDLHEVLSCLEEQGYYEHVNRHIDSVVEKLEEILTTGKQPGKFGGEKLQAFAERLLELRGLADPDFGVDPKDSNELCKLRQAIDDHLVWPSPAAEDRGRYEEAVEHSGKLAKRFQFMQKAYYDAEREIP